MSYNRQNRIVELIHENDISTQDQLVSLLKSEGYDATQATISRDIKELNIIKVKSGDGYRYEINRNDKGVSKRLISIFRGTITGYSVAENLLVVHTLPGCAGAAAEAVDACGFPHIVGTLAGDNTFIIIVEKTVFVRNVAEKFDEMLAKEQINND